MSQGETILSALLAALATITQLKRVVSWNETMDVSGFVMADMPLAAVWLGQLAPNYETGRTAVWVQDVNLSVYFLANENETAERESLKKLVIDKLGSDPTLTLTSENLDLVNMSARGQFPLYEIAFLLRFEYERSISNV